MISPYILITYAIFGWFGTVVYVIFNHLSTCNRIRLVIKWQFWRHLFLLTFTILPTKLTFTLSNLPFMHQVGGILHNLYSFSIHISKNLAKFQKLVDLFNTKGNKLFKNVKTRWINMFFQEKKMYWISSTHC